MESENRATRYGREAEDCRRNAERAKNPVDRAAWLRLAEDWTKLARGAELHCALQAIHKRNAGLTRH